MKNKIIKTFELFVDTFMVEDFDVLFQEEDFRKKILSWFNEKLPNCQISLNENIDDEINIKTSATIRISFFKKKEKHGLDFVLYSLDDIITDNETK